MWRFYVTILCDGAELRSIRFSMIVYFSCININRIPLHICLYTYIMYIYIYYIYMCVCVCMYRYVIKYAKPNGIQVRSLWLLKTHWGRVTHICVSKLTIIGSDNGLSPGRRQAIIWTNAGILLIRTLGTNFSEILGQIHSFSFKKMHLKMSSLVVI